jgi:hypothetical protein
MKLSRALHQLGLPAGAVQQARQLSIRLLVQKGAAPTRRGSILPDPSCVYSAIVVRQGSPSPPPPVAYTSLYPPVKAAAVNAIAKSTDAAAAAAAAGLDRNAQEVERDGDFIVLGLADYPIAMQTG